MKGEKGVTVMIGLLGPGKEMGKEADSLLEDDYSECPLATQDEIVNKGNKQKAILTANYGPKEDERMCGNCEYGNKLKGCGLRKTKFSARFLSLSARKKMFVMRGTAAKKKTSVVASRVLLRGWVLSILVR
jgi:hypothetical protein